MNETNTLSPALTAMVAILTIPRQYSQIIAHSVESVNNECPVVVQRIEK